MNSVTATLAATTSICSRITRRMSVQIRLESDGMMTEAQLMHALDGGPTGCAYCGAMFDANPGDCYCGSCLTKFYGI